MVLVSQLVSFQLDYLFDQEKIVLGSTLEERVSSRKVLTLVSSSGCIAPAALRRGLESTASKAQNSSYWRPGNSYSAHAFSLTLARSSPIELGRFASRRGSSHSKRNSCLKLL